MSKDLRPHNKSFRVGKSNFYITVFQGVDPTTKEWKHPIIMVPEMNQLNIPAANAVNIALGKAIKACRELQKFTGRPAR